MSTTRPGPDSGKHTLSYQLRELIEARGLTAYALARDSGLDHRSLARFLAGQRGLTLDSADRLATALGLRLVEVAKKSRPKK